MIRIVRAIKIAFFYLFLTVICYFPTYAQSTDNGLPDGYEPDIYNAIPAQQFKDVFETGTITVSGVEVKSDSYVSIFDENDTIHFRIFNSTTQETEYEIDTVNNMDGTHTLPDIQLKKNHNYIFFVEDPWYQLGTKKYVQILDDGAVMAKDGAGAYDYKYVVKDSQGNEEYNKEYKKLTSISVFKRDSLCEDPREDARCCIGCTDIPVVVTYKGEPVQEKLHFRFVSDYETRKGSTNYLTEGLGILYANLMEDITYMVYLDSDKYVMEPFPIVVKDKSEYGEGRYAYNHTTCIRVDEHNPIKLYDSVDEARNDPDNNEVTLSVNSLKGNVTVTGMNFRHILILDRLLDRSAAPVIDGKDFEVIGITAVNPHRWEISKLTGTDFTINKKIEHNKLVKNVYCVQGNSLKELEFDQNSADNVRFIMDSLSLYPVVIKYDSDRTYEQAQQEKSAKEKAEREKAEREKAKREKAEQERKDREAAWKGTIDRKLPVPKAYKPKVVKKCFTAKWKKLSGKQLRKAGSIKIEIQYSLERSFPMEKTKSKLTGKKKSSAKIKSLKSGKTYYVRVRTYKTVKGVKHVSRWSKVKKVKTK